MLARLPLLLFIALLAPAPAPAQTLSAPDMEAMMRAMLTMMRLWNNFQGSGDWGLSAQWDAASGAPRYDPWGAARPIPGRPFAPSTPWSVPWGGSVPGSAGSPLAGTWRGASGETLVVRGNRFLLRGQDGRALSGRLAVHDGALMLRDEASGSSRRYFYELRGEYLALADDTGQVLLFRRGAGTRFPSPPRW